MKRAGKTRETSRKKRKRKETSAVTSHFAGKAPCRTESSHGSSNWETLSAADIRSPSVAFACTASLYNRVYNGGGTQGRARSMPTSPDSYNSQQGSFFSFLFSFFKFKTRAPGCCCSLGSRLTYSETVRPPAMLHKDTL